MSRSSTPSHDQRDGLRARAGGRSIGKRGKFFSPEEAEDYIAGYIVFNDITARDIQREEMKSGVFCLSQGDRHVLPDRPWIVTADEIPDPHNLSM